MTKIPYILFCFPLSVHFMLLSLSQIQEKTKILEKGSYPFYKNLLLSRTASNSVFTGSGLSGSSNIPDLTFCSNFS